MNSTSIVTRTTRQGERLTFGLAAELGVDAEAKWVTICETHGSIIESSSRQLAYKTTGIDFCDDCRSATREGQISTARAVDTELANLWDLYHTEADKLDQLAKHRDDLVSNRTSRWFPANDLPRNEERIVEAEAAIEAQRTIAQAARAVATDYDAKHYTGWNRFFLVQHIHRSMHCSSFRWNTRIGWLPNVSGLTEAEAVAEHGATLCTICFPSAPVELTTAPVDPSICTQGRDYDAPSRSGYVSGNYGTCKCGQRVAMTTTGKLRKHKVA